MKNGIYIIGGKVNSRKILVYKLVEEDIEGARLVRVGETFELYSTVMYHRPVNRPINLNKFLSEYPNWKRVHAEQITIFNI